MEALLKPGVLLLNRLRYPQKFLLISLVFLLPLLGIGFVLQAEMNQQVDFVSQERQGLSDINRLREPLKLMQQHRGLSAALLGGDSSVKSDLQRVEEDLATAMGRLDALKRGDSEGSAIEEEINSLQRGWDRLSTDARNLSGSESFEQHTGLIENILTIKTIVAERSKLILDSEPESNYLVDMVINRLPELTESMGQARGIGSGVAAEGRHSGRSWLELGIRQDQITKHMEAFNHDLERTFELKPGLEDSLGGLSERAHDSVESFNSLLESEFSDPDQVDASAGDVIDESTRAINQVFDVFDETVPVLDSLLAERESYAAAVRNTTLATMVAVLLVMVYLFTAFYRGITGTIQDLESTTAQLAEGDLTTRIPIRSRDELGDVAQALNRMVESFERVVKQVMQSTEQVAQAAEELSTVTEQTSNGVTRQRSETDQVASAMSELSSTVKEVANNTSAAAEAANEVNSEASEGRAELEKMITRISALADDMENAGRVIKELQERSNEIGNVLDVINEIADQTNLLALNAAIEAARAGESGRGFAVVADEVRSLAGRTQSSTEQIQETIERLQGGANDAVRVIEQGRTQSSESVEMASTTGQSLESILKQVANISDMNSQVASATEQQSSVAEEMDQNINRISEVAEESAAASDQTAESSQNLSKLSQELLESVSHFKVA